MHSPLLNVISIVIYKLQGTSTKEIVVPASTPEWQRGGSMENKIAQARRSVVQRTERREQTGVRRTLSKPDKVKKVWTYDGYIQKKFSLSIMTYVLLNLCVAESDWVKKVWFEHLLGFRMISYPHGLGYNIVDAFCSRTYALKKQGIF
ncbi:hypothetical protein ACET3Z_012355 [Daucus carota]